MPSALEIMKIDNPMFAQKLLLPKYLIFISISLANLNICQVWREILFSTDSDEYYNSNANLYDYIAAIITLCLLSSIIYVVLRLISRLDVRYRFTALVAVFALLMINPLNFLRTEFKLTIDLVPNYWIGYLMVAGAIFILALFTLPVRFRRNTAIGICFVLLGFAPVAFLNIAYASWKAVGAGTNAGLVRHSAPPSPVSANTRTANAHPMAKQRVVWINFSGLDSDVLFSKRPSSHRFPAFDRLAAQSLVFNNAVPPGGHMIKSTPALWLGEKVAYSKPLSHDLLQVRTQGNPKAQSIARLPHIFETAMNAGAKTAISGFYHPYCRLFAGFYDHCENLTFARMRLRPSRGFADALTSQWRTLSPYWRRMVYAEAFRQSRDTAVRIANDPRYNFVAIHFPLPHMPAIFDSQTKTIRPTGIGLSYYDNVAASDQALQGIMDAMKSSGEWDRTAVLVTSSYGWAGVRNGRNPEPGASTMIVKFPHQLAPAAFDERISATRIKQTISKILSCEVKNVAQLISGLRG